MAIDTKSFEMQLKAGLVEIREQAQEVLIETGLEIFKNSILDTPVDDGSLRANWHFDVDKVNTDTDTSKTSNEGLKAGEELAAKLKADGTKFEYISISNNLPYARVVEYGLYPDPPKIDSGKTENGYSKLAPEGMFRKNLLKFHSTARKNAKRIMGKK